MRSRWVGRLFGQADGGGAGLGKPQWNAPPVLKTAKHSTTRNAGTMPAAAYLPGHRRWQRASTV